MMSRSRTWLKRSRSPLAISIGVFTFDASVATMSSAS